MEFRLNNLNRMPLTAVEITSQAQEKSLLFKTKTFIVLDVLIIVNLLVFLIFSPIKPGPDLACNEKTCNSTGFCSQGCSFLYWDLTALVVGIASLTLDCFTLCQIRKRYINAVTAISGFFIDICKCTVAIIFAVMTVNAIFDENQ